MTIPAIATKRFPVFLFIFVTLWLASCNKKKREADLSTDLGKVDQFLRRGTFDYDSLLTYVAALRDNFTHAERKQKAYEVWHTTVDYKWNADSSIILVNAYKTYPIGFSRETIIHVRDSLLLVHRFSTEPLGMENRDDFTFLESVLYLAPGGTIKHLARISYREKNLNDTVTFRKKPFTDLTDNISHYYSLELNYSQNIMGD